ncbi:MULTISPECIES: S41 family peptidase [Idiomarina]|uniref:S41 family peptidase n=1 Tax=Idiomarina TaxID=135575 RepID=UPI00129CB316|nr:MULTISPECIES: S41 family peptidase [Idiomarina]MRJ41934.1 hypothetical protein [Idiomarina sp. FeN1]NCU57217.1 hypothetical protein [Idiomarina sp. FenA--70]NCU59926.1 hypothetical protein [Idiomarina sp. FenBw--71]UUN12842.1 hypothetical protein KGF88_09285 [Idiomarina loihiensis]
MTGISKRCRLALGGLLLALSGCTASLAPQQLEIADGVYWSAQYHSYLEAKDGLLTRYQYTPSQCWRADAGLLPRVFSSAYNPGQHEWVGAGRNTLVLRRLSDGIPVFFTREPLLPAPCRQPPEASASAVIDTLAEVLTQFQHGLSQTELLRWRYQAQRLDAQHNLTDTDKSVALYQLVREVLVDSDDRHAFVLARELGAYYRVNPFSVGEAQRELSRQQWLQELQQSALYNGCEQALWWGLLSSGEYYLGVLRLHGFTSVQQGLQQVEVSYSEAGQRCLQRALDKLASDLKKASQSLGKPPSLLIDLRFNEGGSLLLASQLALSLQAQPLPFASINQHQLTEQRRPDLSRLYQGGRVLVSEITASAAEHLAQALRLRGFSLHGQTTRGAFSPTIVKSLPNGWIIGVSMYAPATLLDGHGQALPEGAGLVPDQELPATWVFPVR